MGPCEPLVTPEDVIAACGWDDMPADEIPDAQAIADSAAAASYVAWALQGRTLGMCSIIGERPGRFNTPPHDCGGLSSVFTSGAPVATINEVRIGGEVIPPEEYRLYLPNRIVRMAPDAWPRRQMLNRPDDYPSVLVVDYTWGMPVSAQARAAIAAFACEIAKAHPGVAGECVLPKRVTSIVREGVSITLLDPFDFFEKGKTGVYQFDLWLSTTNPHGLTGRSSVGSPDVAAPIGGRLAPQDVGPA